MNDLFSSGRRLFGADGRPEAEMSPAAVRGGAAASTATAPGEYNYEDEMNLRRFFEEVNEVKEEMAKVKERVSELARLREEGKAQTREEGMKRVRAATAAAVGEVQRRAATIKKKLEEIERGNAANRRIPGCGAGSASDRTRTAVTAGLRRSLAVAVADLRAEKEAATAEQKEAVGRRYFALTGKEVGEDEIERMAAEGEEGFWRRAVAAQGGAPLAALAEAQEGGALVAAAQGQAAQAAELAAALAALQQMFLDMSVLVADQGTALDDIEANVSGAEFVVRAGAADLQTAVRLQHNTRKWSCILALIIAAVIIVIVVPLLVKFVPSSS